MNRKNPYSFVVDSVRGGGIGVIPTDTIYGIVGSALDKKTVKKIYRLRKRSPKKPMIILISSMDDLKRFGVATTPAIKKILRKIWPGKVSVVMPTKKFEYLHRGTESLAFRLPKPAALRAFIRETGPIVAPSANFEGKLPACTIKEAKKYFDDRISFYIDVGRLISKPSTLIKIVNGKIAVLRPGAVKI